MKLELEVSAIEVSFLCIALDDRAIIKMQLLEMFKDPANPAAEMLSKEIKILKMLREKITGPL